METRSKSVSLEKTGTTTVVQKQKFSLLDYSFIFLVASIFLCCLFSFSSKYNSLFRLIEGLLTLAAVLSFVAYRSSKNNHLKVFCVWALIALLTFGIFIQIYGFVAAINQFKQISKTMHGITVPFIDGYNIDEFIAMILFVPLSISLIPVAIKSFKNRN